MKEMPCFIYINSVGCENEFLLIYL